MIMITTHNYTLSCYKQILWFIVLYVNCDILPRAASRTLLQYSSISAHTDKPVHTSYRPLSFKRNERLHVGGLTFVVPQGVL